MNQVRFDTELVSMTEVWPALFLHAILLRHTADLVGCTLLEDFAIQEFESAIDRGITTQFGLVHSITLIRAWRSIHPSILEDDKSIQKYLSDWMGMNESQRREGLPNVIGKFVELSMKSDGE